LSGGTAVDLSNAIITAADKNDTLANIFDNDLTTRWGSGRPQSPDMFVQIKFPSPITFSAISLEQGLWSHDIPRKLSITLAERDKECLLFDSVLKNRLLNTFNLFSKPLQTSVITLRLLGTDPVFDWSIAEVRVMTNKK